MSEPVSDFAEECARQARLVRAAEAASGQEDDEFWADLSDTTGWTA